jgi:hypothetical protein
VTAGAHLLRVLGPLQGARIPGGCEHCDAYQTAEPIQATAWRITVHHDADCPWLAARKSRKAA